jgi:hypothetical protein
MMRRIFLSLAFCAFCTHHAFAQSDYSRYEVGGLASIMGADTKGAFNNDNSRDGMYGFDIHGAYNISRLFGLSADFSYFQKQFLSGTSNPTSRLTQITAGIKLQDNAKATRFRPFAQALVGVGHATNLPRVLPQTSSNKTVTLITGTGPALVLGGGLDIRLTKTLDLRALQFDYNPVWAKSEAFHNLRLGIGVNFRF